jgi:hypothetical protein
MLRATVWTVGLFGAGTALCRAFPSTWTEPLVLFALGLALLFVSAHTARETRAVATASTVSRPVSSVAAAAAKATQPPPVSPLAATAQVQVERTA